VHDAGECRTSVGNGLMNGCCSVDGADIGFDEMDVCADGL